MSGERFSRRQLVLLCLVTLCWGFNWPVLKLGVSGYPPLSFRALSMAFGLPLLFAATRLLKTPPYNSVLIFGLAQPAWLMQARDLPPAASTLSVMLIPVLGTLSGAWFLRETVHWQDGVALLLTAVAIASVVWMPRRQTPPR